MAITKIHAIKSTLGKALAYIENRQDRWSDAGVRL